LRQILAQASIGGLFVIYPNATTAGEPYLGYGAGRALKEFLNFLKNAK